MRSAWLKTVAADSRERTELLSFAGVIVLLHAVGWGLVWLAARRSSVVVGLAGLAYTFGLRHAFDADHIAAIDNTTRKLMQDGKQPMGVGFFFSLGHSTVGFLVALALGFTVQWIGGGEGQPSHHDTVRGRL